MLFCLFNIDSLRQSELTTKKPVVTKFQKNISSKFSSTKFKMVRNLLDLWFLRIHIEIKFMYPSNLANANFAIILIYISIITIFIVGIIIIIIIIIVGSWTNFVLKK